MKRIEIAPLTREAFAPYGQLIDLADAENFPINNGMCTRFNDLATVEMSGENAHPLVNIFRGKPYDLPLHLKMLERHPYGSQAFIPMTKRPFLVTVAGDDDGTPLYPKAFLTRPGQGINIGQNVWHGVLTTLGETSDFVVIDRGGVEDNLVIHDFDEGYIVDFAD